jgi:hypothetical protein
MRFLGLLLIAATFAAPAAEPLPALYSFADVYRLTVGHAPVGLPQPQAGEEAPIRVAVVESSVAEPRFTVRQFPAPTRWLLALAGLALAAWVAHRRLSYL